MTIAAITLAFIALVSFVSTNVDAAEPLSPAQVVMSSIMLLITFGMAALVTAISGRMKRTEAAVHTEDGVSVSDQVKNLNSRVSGNENRMNSMADRMQVYETREEWMRRRVDQLHEEHVSVAKEHGTRLGSAEKDIEVLKALQGPTA